MAITKTFRSDLMLQEEDIKQGFWVQDDVHLSHALTPLFASFMVPAVTEGTKVAFENLKMPLSQFRYKLADGRIYQYTVPYPGDLQKRLGEHKETMGSILPMLNQHLKNYVDQVFLPFYWSLDGDSKRALTVGEAKEKLLGLFDFYRKAWQLHFEIVLPRTAFMALEQMYGQLTGSADTVVVYDMLAGVMNKSLETDRELWKLADWAKQSPVLVAAFAEEATEVGYKVRIEQTEEGLALLKRLQDVLEIYGQRSTNSHEFNDETWAENPEYALRIIARYIKKDYDFDREFAETVRQREAKAEEVIAGLPEVELKQTFVRMYQWALDSWGLDEDHHFYIDAMLPAKSRQFLLKVGRLLVDQGVLEDKSDIFFLYLDELLAMLSEPTPLHAQIEQRKMELEVNKQKQPAPFYGTPPEVPMDPALERIFGGKPPEIQEQTFTGYAASQGTYTGMVKVVRRPEDFSKIQQGDVLVCKTTTPPWTVLFSIVGAIVTDAGGILSHAGTVAREYKLPAVVGSKVATSLLKDGDIVTVDGTKGVVHFGQQS
ncbi:PEP-utilizing enzyme [Paenibacillus sp. WQ 127069]|uniref:PEP-utilizing enzyme n=1 Tax=Paenibacillus baimaensis TaxID=2982185 RepID=A0ABT2U9J0_9BACL|nr:PEP-utilizing enzyme [Paenibacillus sp. WQ 127069]MCU6791314.1 PEP-utilizing enzyme [Paenibacillus sp. WQ 127069]